MTDEDKPADEESPLWALSRDEQRLLWITFVGGLGSIVVGAGAIGGAIALSRLARQGGEPLWLLLGLTVMAVAAVGFGAWLHRGDRQGRWYIRSGRLAVVERVMFRWMVLFAAFFALVWIGVAAGVK